MSELKDGPVGPIPVDWEESSIASISSNVTAKMSTSNSDVRARYIGLEHIGSGTNRLVAEGSSDDVISTKTSFSKGDTLYGKLRPYLSKVWLAQFSGICSTDILAVRPNNRVTSEYLFRVLSTDKCIQFATGNSAGNIMPRTSWSELKQYEFTLPPLPEQKKIASILTSVDDVIEKTEAQIATS